MLKNSLFIILILLISCGGSSSTETGLTTQALSIQTSTKTLNLTVEVADTGVERAFGLMERESLDADKGMLFIFSTSGKHSFWMKNTILSLDIIWINSDKEIVFIAENTTPFSEVSISPTDDALYVLEVNAGYVSENGVNVGDKLSF